MLRIVADEVEILGAPLDLSRPVEGLFVEKDGFEGWDDGGGESVREEVQRPASIGIFDMPVFEAGMPFSVGGHALAQDPYTLALLRDRVTGVGRGGRRFQVNVEHQGRTLWTWARRGAKPQFKDTGRRHGRHHAKFLLQFVAPIPRKYGEPHDVAAGVIAFNAGNEDAIPRLIIGAGVGGYTVSGPGGRVITVNTNAPAGEHSIDFATGGLFNAAGARVPNAISVWQPWAIPPGLPGVVATISGTRTLRQVYPDTYN